MKSLTVLCAFCGKNLSKEDPIIVLKKSKRNNYLAKYNSVLELKKYVFFHKTCYFSNLKVKKRFEATNSVNSVSSLFLFFIILIGLVYQVILISKLPFESIKVINWHSILLFIRYLLFVFSIVFAFYLFFRAVYTLYLVYKYDLFIKTKFFLVVIFSFILGMVLFFSTFIIDIKPLLLSIIIGSLGIAFMCISIVGGHITSFKIKE